MNAAASPPVLTWRDVERGVGVPRATRLVLAWIVVVRELRSRGSRPPHTGLSRAKPETTRSNWTEETKRKRRRGGRTAFPPTCLFVKVINNVICVFHTCGLKINVIVYILLKETRCHSFANTTVFLVCFFVVIYISKCFSSFRLRLAWIIEMWKMWLEASVSLYPPSWPILLYDEWSLVYTLFFLCPGYLSFYTLRCSFAFNAALVCLSLSACRVKLDSVFKTLYYSLDQTHRVS